MTTLDTTVTYKVDGFRGIAFRLKGWDKTYPLPEFVLVCDDDECDHEKVECRTWEEQEPEESDTWVRVVMVGDNIVHVVEYADLTPLEEGASCAECGQIGCSNDGRAS